MPFTSQGAARDAINAFFVAGLAARLPQWENPVVIFDDKNTPAPPTDQQPYLRYHLRHFDRNQRSVGGAGGRRFRAKFQITIKIYVELGHGYDDYTTESGQNFVGTDTIAQALMAIFQGKTTGVDQAQFYRVRTQEYGEDEGRFRTNVLINGDYDTIG